MVTFIVVAHFGCHDILTMGPIKWRQRTDMTIAVDRGINHQFEQTYKTSETSLRNEGLIIKKKKKKKSY